MGGATPWQFFTDHQEPELAEAVRQGRRREFAATAGRPRTFPTRRTRRRSTRSKLDWTEREPQHGELLAVVPPLIALRRAEPELADPRLDRVSVEVDEDERWVLVERGAVALGDQLPGRRGDGCRSRARARSC